MKIPTGLFILSSIYLICTNQFGNVSATSSGGNNANLENRRQHTRPSFVRVPLGRPPIQYARFKSEPFNDFLDDDDLFELSKRQTSDDYGHLRFGKRGEDSFDDYGHMRFGRSGSD